MTVNFLLSYSILLCEEIHQSIKFADFFIISLINEGLTLCNSMILIINNRKINQFSHLEYSTVI